MKKISFYLIHIILILAFSKGILELGGVSSSFSQLIIEVLILLVFGISILFVLEKKLFYGTGVVFVFSFLVIIFISFLLNNTTLLQMLLFLRAVLIYILFFYAVLNIPFTQEEKTSFLKLLLFLFLIQIPASIIKLVILGGTLEGIVGTMTIDEGSLATIMPLIASVVTITKYLVTKEVKYIILLLSFIGIGLISNKLGILFYVMFMFILLTYLYSTKQGNSFVINTFFLKKMVSTIIYISIIFSLFVIINPRANPEHKVGGSIDIEYLINFTNDYNSLKLKGSRVEADGRSDAPFVAIDKLSQGGILNILIGYGPGDIVQSSLLKYKDPLLSKYNIGYGGRLGLVWIMIQLGILGVISFLSFHIFLLYRAYIFFKTSKENEYFMSLSILSISIVYFIDFFTYSSQMLLSPGVALTYMMAMYYLSSYEKVTVTV